MRGKRGIDANTSARGLAGLAVAPGGGWALRGQPSGEKKRNSSRGIPHSARSSIASWKGICTGLPLVQ